MSLLEDVSTNLARRAMELIVKTGDETIEPRRNLPKAMMLSVVIVGVTYTLVSIASVLAVKELGTGWASWAGADVNTMFSRIVRTPRLYKFMKCPLSFIYTAGRSRVAVLMENLPAAEGMVTAVAKIFWQGFEVFGFGGVF